MKKIIKYFFIAGLVLGLIVLYSVYTKVYSSIVDEETIIYIEKTGTYTELKEKLRERKIIANETLFDALSDKMNLKNNIHSGKYILKEGTNTLDLIRKFRGNKQSPVKMVINNVNFKADLAGKVSNQVDIDSLEFLNFLKDKEKLNALNFNKDNIMCQFVPNTYEMYWSLSQESFVKKMMKEHDRFWNNNRKTKAKELGLSTDEVFILASIVEKEYKFANERRRIAGVYLNRINIRMPLQADPTCKFAWGDLSLKRVLFKHTENPHPYNTYYINGLPPGPICLPETSTIDAVLNAEEHKYLYFCAHADLDGKHEFNTNLAAHNRAAIKYQKALNKLKIY